MTTPQPTKEKATILTAERGPDSPYLEVLTTATWAKFIREYRHYRSLGGKKLWPKCVTVTILGVVKDLTGVPVLTSKENRKKALEAMEKVFASTSSISLYDELRTIKMEKVL
ncbi:hypothetical protein ADUPG1_005251, partial [Aduncisulcus paluster]